MMDVCFFEDDYVRELQEDRRTPVWMARLSGGRTAWMDDYRPGVHPHSAWLRLAAWLAKSGESILSLSVKFRSNEFSVIPHSEFPIPHSEEFPIPHLKGFFFSKGAARTDAMDTCLSFYLLGWLTTGGILYVRKVLVPELLLLDEGVRDPLLAGDCLIRNPHD